MVVVTDQHKIGGLNQKNMEYASGSGWPDAVEIMVRINIDEEWHRAMSAGIEILYKCIYDNSVRSYIHTIFCQNVIFCQSVNQQGQVHS
jgi:hypothetical protein